MNNDFIGYVEAIKNHLPAHFGNWIIENWFVSEDKFVYFSTLYYEYAVWCMLCNVKGLDKGEFDSLLSETFGPSNILYEKGDNHYYPAYIHGYDVKRLPNISLPNCKCSEDENEGEGEE